MQIGQVENADKLQESQLQFGFLAHHLLVPLGLEHQVDGGAFYAFYRFNLLADVFHDEVGGGAVGGGEGHVDGGVAAVGHVYFVDEAQVVDVDGDFGVATIFSSISNFVISQQVIGLPGEVRDFR